MILQCHGNTQCHTLCINRRITLLELFGEDISTISDKAVSCCDVWAMQCDASSDLTEELSILHDAINTIGSKGEVKLAQWIRSSALSWTDPYDMSALS